MKSALPTGIVTPLVAFVTSDGEPAEQAMRALVEHQISNGVAAVLANGSMGELGNLTATARRTMVRTVVNAAAGRVPVWAGVAGLGTAESIAAARDARDEGADALLVLPPLFFDLGDSELHRHFAAVASAVDIPVLAYDVPPRTPRKLPPELIAAMAADGTIQGVKDSSGSLTAARQVCLQTSQIAGFRAYLGTELAIDAAPALGFAGSVPGLANILPAVATAVDNAARNGDSATAAQQQQIYLRLMDGLIRPWPGAGAVAIACGMFKAATAHILGLAEPQTLAPMTPPDREALQVAAQVVDSLLGG